MLRCLPALLAFGLLATPARAEWMSGEQLQDTCSTTAPVDRAMCLSYVIGVLDGFRSLDRAPKVPESVSAGEVRSVVASYLADHPEARSLEGRMVVKAAVADAWPDIQPKAEAAPKRKVPVKVRKRRTRG
ncbi:hypothetical protein IQ25_00606 [Novosphingobium taihuense]|nr:hypothetical protein IQ25_00606 [Novosphingobium taihuense]